MLAAKKADFVGQDALHLNHRLGGYQKCAEDVMEGDGLKEMLLP